MHRKFAAGIAGLALALGVAALPHVAVGDLPALSATSTDDWSGLSRGNGRTGFDDVQTALTPANAAGLHQAWSSTVNGHIVDQPVVANGTVYVGSQAGYVSALDLNGNPLWSSFVGATSATCPSGGGSTGGVADTPAVANLGSGQVVVVGGGDGYLYELDASTGSVRWRTRLAVTPAGFLWGSPAVFNGSVYEGVASFDDCPLVRGALVRLDLSTGTPQNVTWTLPSGCTGATIWSTPAIDELNGVVYVATGNAGTCQSAETMADAIIAMRASDLSVLDMWQVPLAQQCVDCDFGATPTLFSAFIGGQPRDLLGVASKDGFYYAFDRHNLAAGPLWQVAVARHGEDPIKGDGSISTSAFDGTSLYVAGGGTTVGSRTCGGSLRSLNPATGSQNWIDCASSPILGSVSATTGLVMVSVGMVMAVLSSATGSVLFTFRNSSAYGFFVGGVSISLGVLYAGSFDGSVRAFTPS